MVTDNMVSSILAASSLARGARVLLTAQVALSTQLHAREKGEVLCGLLSFYTRRLLASSCVQVCVGVSSLAGVATIWMVVAALSDEHEMDSVTSMRWTRQGRSRCQEGARLLIDALVMTSDEEVPKVDKVVMGTNRRTPTASAASLF
jgi:hypothetical protein